MITMKLKIYTESITQFLIKNGIRNITIIKYKKI